MFRPLAALLTMLTLSPALPAQDNVDAAWKDLINKGTELSADAHDNAQAEQIFLKALHEAEHFGASDIRVGATHNRLGMVYREEKKYQDAENSFRKALAIFEDLYGADSLDVANINYNIGNILLMQGKAPAALSALKKSLDTYRRLFGDASLKTADALCGVGDSLRLVKAWQEAEAPLHQCAQIREQDGGVLSPDFGEAENSLAFVYHREGKYALSDSAFKMAEKIRERSKGITSPDLADTLEGHAALLREMGRDLEAGKDARVAESIRKLQNRVK
jgi:tetratricopeptide (TPR) repeat protein